MDLVKKEKEIQIEDKSYIMAFDMKSIATYKELTGNNFNRGVHRLFSYDDEEIINFIACTLRNKSTPDKPLGAEVKNGDILYFLLNHTGDVIDLIADSLPNNNSKKK